MQRYELEAWLGDDHGLTNDQITDLLATADDIGRRYPDPDDQGERDAALTTAYRLMIEDPEVITADLCDQLLRCRLAEARARASVRQAALTLVKTGGRGINSQEGFAKRVGVDRMSVRNWHGLR